MSRNWEIFDIGPRDGDNNLHVTLGRKGNLMIGCAAFRRLGQPDAAMLMYERESGLIGVRGAHIRAEHAYPMKVPERGSHRVVRASRFCKHYGISVDQTVRFRMAVIEDGVLILDTKSMVNISR